MVPTEDLSSDIGSTLTVVPFIDDPQTRDRTVSDRNIVVTQARHLMTTSANHGGITRSSLNHSSPSEGRTTVAGSITSIIETDQRSPSQSMTFATLTHHIPLTTVTNNWTVLSSKMSLRLPMLSSDPHSEDSIRAS
ncbi:hypothetical protein NPIL_478241 [Nephila pilipes]|uniref:Uncharacterized protein n=1 Tax=Nephila pilipes TaxID=299642 RepID=A0A8X6UIX8_NEPPI|nr:hypothetical protein NPIL_478241 [Nephila pilipes]